jgi:hypothetical protein
MSACCPGRGVDIINQHSFNFAAMARPEGSRVRFSRVIPSLAMIAVHLPYAPILYMVEYPRRS